MRIYVSKLVDVEFMDVVYLVWAEGADNKPLAKLNPLAMKKFIEECQRAYSLPVNVEEQLEQRKQEGGS